MSINDETKRAAGLIGLVLGVIIVCWIVIGGLFLITLKVYEWVG